MQSRIQIIAVICTFIASCHSLYAQEITHADFTWTFTERCIYDGEMFVTQEEKPRITSMSRKDFDRLAEEVLSELDLNPNATGGIKIWLYFIEGQPLCVPRIGDAFIHLTDHQRGIIADRFNLDVTFTPGRQRDRVVACRGILDLTIRNGHIYKVRLINFTF